MIAIGLINSWILYKTVKGVIGWILFPYAQPWVKFSYHQAMNEKMCNEMKSTLEKVFTILNSDMNQKSHIMSKPISEIRDKMHQIKKVIDYLKLFRQVNNELIENS